MLVKATKSINTVTGGQCIGQDAFLRMSTVQRCSPLILPVQSEDKQMHEVQAQRAESLFFRLSQMKAY